MNTTSGGPISPAIDNATFYDASTSGAFTTVRMVPIANTNRDERLTHYQMDSTSR